MGNSQSPSADPRFATASRAFSKQELDDLESLFVSIAAQSQRDSEFVSPSVFQAYFGIKGSLGSRMFDLVTLGRKDGMLAFEDLVIAKAVYEKGTREEMRSSFTSCATSPAVASWIGLIYKLFWVQSVILFSPQKELNLAQAHIRI